MKARVGCWLALSASLIVIGCSDGGSANDGPSAAGAGASSGAGGTAGEGAGGTGGAAGSIAGSGGSGGSGGSAGTQSTPTDGGMHPSEPDGGMMVDAGDPGSVIAEPDDDSSYVFDDGQLRSYNLVLAQADLDTIDLDPKAEQYVQGMLEHDGMQIGPVGIRYKGSVGAFQQCTGFAGEKVAKCSLKVAFDHVDEAGRFHDLKKLNFHAMNADPSMLRERLVYAMFRENGVAAPRATHARLSINGQHEGLFALVEQIDGRFTRARFTEGGEGNLYKEVWPMHDEPSTYLAALESNRDEVPSAARMLGFKAAIAEGPDAMASWIDRDYFLRYLAADRVTINDDGALHWWCTPLGQGNNPGGIGNHNYYWYEAAGADRLWIIPWDVDMSLAGNPVAVIGTEWRQPGACTCGEAGFAGTAPVCDPLIAAWASWSADYEAAVDDFIAGPFSAANVNAKLDAWTAQIEAAVQQSAGINGAPDHGAWMTAVANLRATIDGARMNRGTKY